MTAVALSPDGKRLLTGGAGTAKLWSTETGALLLGFGFPGEFLKTVAFTSDGLSALTAGDDGSAKLWDLKTGRRLRVYGGAPARIESLALSPDGRRLAYAAGGPDIWVWDVGAGTIVQQFTGGGPWNAVAFSPDGKSVISGGPEGLSVWDIASGRDSLAVKGAAASAVAQAGGALIGCGGNTARVWNAGSGTPARALIGHLDAVRALAASPDGRRLATGSDDHTARLWNPATGELLRAFGGGSLPVLYAALPARGARLVTVDRQKAALWDLDAGRPVSASTGDFETASHFCVSDDGRYLAGLRESELVDLRDLEQGKDLGSLRWNLLKARALALEPGGRFLVTAREESLQAWDVPGADERPILGGHKERAGWLAVGLDGKRLVTRTPDGAAVIWDLDSGRRVARIKLEPNSLPDLAVSRDGRYLAAGFAARTGAAGYSLSVRALTDGEEIRSFREDREVEPLAFSPKADSLLVLAAGKLEDWSLTEPAKKPLFAPGEAALLDWPEAVDPAWRYLLARRGDELVFLALDGGRELASLRLFEKGWLAQAPDGSFDASPEAARWTVGLASYPLERFGGPRLSRGLLGRRLR